jgi:hypothetical protein
MVAGSILEAPTPNPRDALLGQAQGRLDRGGSQLLQWTLLGPYIDVNGVVLDGSTNLQFNSALQNVMASNGTDSGALVTVSTLYYVYCVADAGSPYNLSLAACTTAPAQNARTGLFELPTAPNDLYLFVGWAFTDSAGLFQDNDAQRLVVSYFNRSPKRLLIKPGYVDDNAATSISIGGGGTTWAPLNGGTADFAEYISNGVDPVRVQAHAQVVTGAGVSAAVGLGDNSTTTVQTAWNIPASQNQAGSVSAAFVNAVGYRKVNFLARSSAAATVTCDAVRNGSASDPCLTYLVGSVMA